MKKLLTVLLAAAVVLSVAPLSVTAKDKEEDYYDNQYIFSIKEDNSVLWPGTDYYFECDWQGSPITDEFFELYSVSVSVNSSDKDSLSASNAKRLVEKAEFVKLNNSDKYYFNFKAKASYSYSEDADLLVYVLAQDKTRDKNRTDSRSWHEMDLSVGYQDKETTQQIGNSQYDVDNDISIVEFEDDVKSCRLDFEDGSFYNARISKIKRFNLGHNTVENTAIKKAYPAATFKFLSFYAHPSFAYESVLKVKAPEQTKYLYEIGDNNALTLVSDVNNNGYFGYTTSRLGSYVASSVPLDSAKVSISGGAAATTKSAANPPAASGATASAPTAAVTNPQTGAAI